MMGMAASWVGAGVEAGGRRASELEVRAYWDPARRSFCTRAQEVEGLPALLGSFRALTGRLQAWTRRRYPGARLVVVPVFAEATQRRLADLRREEAGLISCQCAERSERILARRLTLVQELDEHRLSRRVIGELVGVSRSRVGHLLDRTHSAHRHSHAVRERLRVEAMPDLAAEQEVASR